MSYKHFIFSLLFLMMTLGVWYPAYGRAETPASESETGYCHPSALRHFANEPLQMDSVNSILIEPTIPMEKVAKNLRFRWCFTFTAIDTGDGAGGLHVVEFVEIWRLEDKELTLMTVQASQLPCSIAGGGITWDGNSNAISFDGSGYIQCETVDLYETVLMLSEGFLDLCHGEPPCELPATDITNYVDFVPPSNNHPFWNGPLFKYENVLLSGRGVASYNEKKEPSRYEVVLDINHESVHTLIPAVSVQNDFFLAVEQWHHTIDFSINQNATPVAQWPVQTVVTTFGSGNEMIYFGFDPSNPNVYATGSLRNGIFDPPCCGNGFY